MKRTWGTLLGSNKLALSLLAFAVGAAAQWVNYPAAGIPRGADGKPNMSAPAPKTADGKTDLSGIWIAEDQKFFMNLANDRKEDEVPLLPWARALQQQREKDIHRDDPLARCLPQGVPRINTNGMFPFKIIQTPGLVVILYEQLNLFRQVFMDGRKVASNPNPAWLGYSTGRWDGDTLVIETSGFNDQTWLDTEKGHPATESLHVTERFRRKDFGNLEVQATIDDPKAYSKPWTTAAQKIHLLLGTEILEFVCNENEKDAPHLFNK
jgi:hypothetical protein